MSPAIAGCLFCLCFCCGQQSQTAKKVIHSALLVTHSSERRRDTERDARAAAAEAFPLGQKHSEPLASARTRNRKMMQCVRPESELESKSEREEIPARRPTTLARPLDPLIIQMMFKRVALALFFVAACTKQAVVNFAQALHLTYAQYSLQITVELVSAPSHLAISH